MVPAVGTETPAIRLRSVVLPEPLRPRRTVQDPAGRLRPSMSRTSSVFPSPSGNDFFTLRRTTAGRATMPLRHRNALGGASRVDAPARDHDVIGWRSG